jgi:ribonuclease BN (tRNA processing enzyme)
VKNIPYLIDCGSGVVSQIVAAYQNGTKGLRFQNLKRLFITHLHSDHTVGYPDIIFTPWVLGRNEPMEVYGPDGIKSMTENILAAYQQDIHIRLNGLERVNTSGYKVNVHEIKPGIIYQDSHVKVEAFFVNHGSWPQAFAYKFYTPDRTIVISGDTTYSENMIEQSKGVDVLIHEVYNTKGFEKIKNSQFQAYHSNSHTSSENLAKIATRAKPGLLILYHQLWMNQSEDDLLKEIKERYSGKVVSGKDLEIY